MPEDYNKLKLRKSELITSFGVGAIVEKGGQSLIAMDISRWPAIIKTNKKYRLDSIPRLQKILGINYIVSPPAVASEFWKANNQDFSVPYHRFPKWLECRNCKSLRKYTNQRAFDTIDEISCQKCKKDGSFLSPTRFIFAPEDGYLNDIEWPFFVHIGNKDGCKSWELSQTIIKGSGGGLSAIKISCDSCGAQKNMKQISDLIFNQRSSGVQPWTANYDNRPKSDPKSKHNSFQQRGATSLYQPKMVSALDLSGSSYEDADDSSLTKRFLDGHEEIETLKETIKTIKNAKSYNDNLEKNLVESTREIIIRDLPDEVIDISIDEIKEFIDHQVDSEKPEEVDLSKVDDEALKLSEYNLMSEDGSKVFKNYDGEKYKIKDKKLGSIISSVTQIKKLREVRVLKGYTRFHYPKEHSVNESDQRLPFLPGYEVFGEGMFIQFDTQAIKKWESNSSSQIKSRLTDMQIRQEQTSASLPFPSAKFVALHTFAHLLIKQLCFESGYAAASIRERLYVNDGEMSGILIYTADADSEGSLGGLVRMSDEKRLVHSILSMIESAKWCSSDPTCIDIGSPGTRGLNKAACHACSLIAETSCAYMNSLLDRGLLIGSEKENIKGLFKDLI